MSHFFLDAVAHHPPAATAIASTLLRTTTAVVLSHSHFQPPSFPYGPAESVSGQEIEDSRGRGKHQLAVSVSFFTSLFPATRLRKLYVKPRSRVLLRAV